MGQENISPSKNPAPPGGMRVAVVLAALLLFLFGGWFWMAHGRDRSETQLDGHIRSTLHLENFVLNLADPDERVYLRAGIDLGLSREAKQGEDGPPLALVRDTILAVLAQAKTEDLLSAQGKNKLKRNLLQALHERVPELGAEEVYFTDFLIQR